jgi:hypothetical protein
MTLARSEFVRLVPAILGGTFGAELGTFVRTEGGRTCRLQVAALPPLVLGSLALERIEVEVVFQGYGPDDQAAFLARFRAVTQRGGG